MAFARMNSPMGLISPTWINLTLSTQTGANPMTHAQALKALVRFGTKVSRGTLWTMVIIYCNAH